MEKHLKRLHTVDFCAAHNFIWTLSNQTNGRVLLFSVWVCSCLSVCVFKAGAPEYISAHAAQTQLKYIYIYTRVYTFSFICFWAMFSSFFFACFFHSTFFEKNSQKRNRNEWIYCCSSSIFKTKKNHLGKSHHHLHYLQTYNKSPSFTAIDKRKI